MLVRAFMEEDVLEPELYAAVVNDGKVSRVPNESEVREILLPFRPERIRKVARVYVDCLADNWRWQEPIFLQTSYDGGATDGEKMSQWIPSDEAGVGLNKGDRWWRLLNDESLFDSGNDWSKVYEMLPEVIAYRNDRRASLDMDKILRAAKRSMSEGTWTEKLESILQAEVQDSSRNTLIVFDKVFFDTCHLTLEQSYAIEEKEGEEGPLLIFLDKKGNQIRASRVGKDILDILDVSYFRLNVDEQHCWEAGVVGEKYKPDGDIGRRYYGPQGTKWTTEPADEDIPPARLVRWRGQAPKEGPL